MGLFNKLFGGSKKDADLKPHADTPFYASDKLMDEDQFWQIIKTTKDNAGDNFEEQQKELATELRQLTPDDIILFANRFR
jgi:hypothetical protein